MTWTPSASAARPLSTFRNGTTLFTSHRYGADSRPSILRSMVSSNRMAPRMRSPSKLGLGMIRLRMSCINANISSSSAYWSSSMPYSLRALGVLPPLWSKAAMKPYPDFTFWNCSSFTSCLQSNGHRSPQGVLGQRCASRAAPVRCRVNRPDRQALGNSGVRAVRRPHSRRRPAANCPDPALVPILTRRRSVVGR